MSILCYSLKETKRGMGKGREREISLYITEIYICARDLAYIHTRDGDS